MPNAEPSLPRPGKQNLAAIALGSNLPSRWGSPAQTLREGLRRLGTLGDVGAVSPFYETEPVGLLAQPRFTNGAALLYTGLTPLALLRALLLLEAGMGRERRSDDPPKGPRVLDLDLLLYITESGESVLQSEPELTLPHPAMHVRRFVLKPLARIAPHLVHPGLGVTVLDLLAQLGAEAEGAR